jgi:hypothetical protein
VRSPPISSPFLAASLISPDKLGQPDLSLISRCDDGGPGASYSFCSLGSDCTDCDPRDTGVSATLRIELGEPKLLGFYNLTTASGQPGRDPTSWSLSCQVGNENMTILSVVEDATPPAERGANYATFSVLPSPPLLPPSPPSPPAPPSVPPPAVPPPAAPCDRMTVTTRTTSYASEQTWKIDGSKEIVSGTLSNSETTTMEVCLEPHGHTITLMDSWGDGWSPGSWVKIETLAGETVVPENGLASGSEQTISFWVGPAPQAPPVSPPEPPAYPAHELVYVAALKSWDDAKTHCETSLDEGVGELVPIHTHEENELVLALCQDDCWIGLQNDTSARHAACAPLRSPPNTRV